MKKILIVEDDVAISKLYDKKFERSGYHVLLAGNGKEALEILKKEHPNIILLDIMMPIMNGFEVMKSLKKSDELKKIPVIILSNYGELPNINQGFNLGADDYLIKVEHTPEDILDIVESILEKEKPLIGNAFEAN